jgi:hypothetical protein
MSRTRITAAVVASAAILGGGYAVLHDGNGGYPDASNTGPSGSLTSVSGNITITTPGTLIENQDRNGCITVQADNVTIRNSRITCDGNGIYNNFSDDHTGLLIEDVIVECGGEPGMTGIANGNYTARRVEVFACENNLWAELNVVIEDSYIHDTITTLGWPETPHTDSIQIPSPASNITIEHNRIYGGYVNQSDFGNAAVFPPSSSGSVTNVEVVNNLMAGGGYTLYCPFEDGGFVWRNNRFSRTFVSTVGGFGPVYITNCAQHDHSENVYHETGDPIS